MAQGIWTPHRPGISPDLPHAPTPQHLWVCLVRLKLAVVLARALELCFEGVLHSFEKSSCLLPDRNIRKQNCSFHRARNVEAQHRNEFSSKVMTLSRGINGRTCV